MNEKKTMNEKNQPTTQHANEGEGMTLEERRAASNTAKLDQEHRLITPIKGKNGAEIVGYQWVSKLEDTATGERRVSAWEESQTSVPTGRNIVHLFWVRTANGEEILMGVGAAKNTLGFDEQRLYSIAKREQENQAYRIKQEKLEARIWEEAAKENPTEAARAFRKNNYSPMRTFEENNAIFNESVLFEKNGKYIRRLPQSTGAMIRNGWKLSENDPAKKRTVSSEGGEGDHSASRASATGFN